LNISEIDLRNDTLLFEATEDFIMQLSFKKQAHICRVLNPQTQVASREKAFVWKSIPRKVTAGTLAYMLDSDNGASSGNSIINLGIDVTTISPHKQSA